MLPPPEAPQRIHVKISLPGEIHRPGMRHQQQQGVHLRRIPPRGKIMECAARPLQPDIVGIKRKERIGQLLQRL